MEKLYIVFDQLPARSAGGLVATYVSLSELLKNEYDIELISIFDYPKEAKEQFPNNKVHVLNHSKIDIRFYRLFGYLKKGKIKKFLWSICSIFIYFIYIPFARIKIRKIIGNERVIVSAPSAGIFMSKHIKFILEIHINYEFFWGKNIIARLQSLLMRTPTLTLFRNERDAKMCKENNPELNPRYIYNFFDNKEIKLNTKQKNHILFMGRLHEQKNLPRLLDLAEMLKEAKPDFILDVYGDGSLRDYMDTEISKRKLENNVFMKGFNSDKSIYSSYSLLWLTSSYEGFGLVIIEAAANNVPTISSAWGPAVYEVIDNGKTGFVCDTNKEFIDKTLLLLNNNDLNYEMSNQAKLNYENKFSKEYAKSNWIRILNNYRKEKQ